MTLETLMAFSIYAVVTLITPGPNNIMLLTSGVNFGVRRSLPHIAGVAGGFSLMVVIVGLGFGTVFELFPRLYTAIQYIGAGYLLYLAWKVANSGSITAKDENALKVNKPMSFWNAAAFQWVNPKAWMIAVGAISIYVPHLHYFTNVLIIALVFCLLGLPAAGSWAIGGRMFRHLLDDEKYIKVFNITMALLLVSSIYPVVIDLLKHL